MSLVASQLGRTQPAISQAINQLEQQLQQPLFRRHKSGCFPNESARMFNNRVKRALEGLDEFFLQLARQLERPAIARLGWHISSGQLLALQALVQQGSLTGAAQALKKSKAAVHRLLREMAEQLEQPLTEATSFGITPTRTARRLAQYSGIAFRELELGVAELANQHQQECGNSRIGAMPMARSYLLPKAILQFKQQHPAHTVTLVEGVYQYLLDDLLSGKLDFLVGARRGVSKTPLTERLLLTESLGLLCSSNHPLASKPDLETADLLQFPWVAPRPESPLRQQFELLFQQLQSAVPDNLIECNSLSAMLVLLSKSSCLTLLSQAQANLSVSGRLLHWRPLPHVDLNRDIVLTTRRGHQFTAVQQQLVMAIEQLAQQLSQAAADGFAGETGPG